MIFVGLFSSSLFARQYDQRTGHFTRRDPIGYVESVGKMPLNLYTYAKRVPRPYVPSVRVNRVDLNLYTYAINNPVNYTDPMGKQAVAEFFEFNGLVGQRWKLNFFIGGTFGNQCSVGWTCRIPGAAVATNCFNEEVYRNPIGNQADITKAMTFFSEVYTGQHGPNAERALQGILRDCGRGPQPNVGNIISKTLWAYCSCQGAAAVDPNRKRLLKCFEKFAGAFLH